MDWTNTLSNLNQNWSDRSLASWAFWNENEVNNPTTGNPNGIPIEAQVAACNTLNANCWLNIPCMASQSYVQSEATLLGSLLNPGAKVYPEFCNEIWNNGALAPAIQSFLVSAGQAAFPDTSSSCPGTPFSSFSYLFSYGVQQQVVYANIFYSTLGASRVVRVLAGQDGYSARNITELTWRASNCGGNGALFSGTAAENVDALATAPYFGSPVPLAWTADADGGLTKFFAEQNSGGVLPTTAVMGDCGNGPGSTCGGASTYTLKSGLGLPATPANGTCLGVRFNQASSGAGTTLAVDGGSAFPLADWLGTPINTNGSYIGTLYSGQVAAACFTNATSQGSVTPQWHLMPNLGYVGASGNGWMAQSIDFWTVQDKATASAYNVGLIAYESGQSYVGGSNPASDNLYFAAMRDPRMGAAYTAYYNALRRRSAGVLNVFNDIGNFSQWGTWGILENTIGAPSPRYSAVVNFINLLSSPNLDVTSKSQDFNGDAYGDILWRDVSGDAALWFLKNASLVSGASVGNIPTAWSIAAIYDFNADGHADILWRDRSGDAALWLMNGSSILQGISLGNIPIAWSVIGTGDFNGDGKGDILWRDTSGDTAIWFTNGRSVTGGASLGTSPLAWSVAGIGDFNGDGTSDILWHDSAGDLTIWEISNGSVKQDLSLGNIPSNWSVAGVGDFNGDGTSDLLWRDTAGDVLVWLMANGTMLQQYMVGNVPMSWRIAEIGDFNGDGRSDILWVDSSGNVAIWFMNGLIPTIVVSLGNVDNRWSVQASATN